MRTRRSPRNQDRLYRAIGRELAAAATKNHYLQYNEAGGATCSAGDWRINENDRRRVRAGFIEHLHHVIDHRPQDGFMVPAAIAEQEPPAPGLYRVEYQNGGATVWYLALETADRAAAQRRADELLAEGSRVRVRGSNQAA